MQLYDHSLTNIFSYLPFIPINHNLTDSLMVLGFMNLVLFCNAFILIWAIGMTNGFELPIGVWLGHQWALSWRSWSYLSLNLSIPNSPTVGRRALWTSYLHPYLTVDGPILLQCCEFRIAVAVSSAIHNIPQSYSISSSSHILFTFFSAEFYMASGEGG